MAIPIACPGCGLTEKGPDHLLGKRLRCKRCKQGFVVGGGPEHANSSAPPAPSSLDFGEPEARPAARRRTKQRSLKPVFVLFLIGFLLGAGGVGGYLYMNKPAASTEEESVKKEEPTRFTWIVKTGGTEKPQDGKPIKD